MSERIQKYLAREGFASRREIERWIKLGRIRHDGGPYKLGDQVEEGDVIYVDERRIEVENVTTKTRVIAYHKKLGEICTNDDPAGRPLAINALPPIDTGRWISVGRLDINTTGLLLFTNDGELANGLMHPSNQVVREYRCRVYGSVSTDDLKRLHIGVRSQQDTLRFDEIELIGGKGRNQWYRIILKQGRNREIRRAWEAVGYQVSRLHRVRYGSVELDETIEPGQLVELSQEHCLQLIQSIDS